MAKNSKSSRPRGITPGVKTGEQLLYKSPMYLEQQKFLKPKTVSQLYFKELREEPDPATIETYGLDLGVGQARALAAVQWLLYNTGFKGNEAHKTVTYSKVFKQDSLILPVLKVTPSEYFEAYGLEKTDVGGKEAYPSGPRREALEDLNSLSEPRQIIYERKRQDGKEILSDIILAPNHKLIDVHLVYEGLKQTEAKEVKSGQKDHTRRLSAIGITCSPIMTAHVDSFYVLKRRDLFKQIAALYPGKRQPRGPSLLVEWLWTLDKDTPISPEHLARYTGLGPKIARRHRREALEDLETYLRHAKSLGYLLDYPKDSFGNYVLKLNPETCSRARSKEKRLAARTTEEG